MKVTVHHERVFALLDVLLARWKKRQFPYTKPDAVIPQTVIPKALRADKEALANFYFYTCVYMRGGIESLQAFRALLRMRDEHPECFDPHRAEHLDPVQLQEIIRSYIGWDSRTASKHWIENSARLVWHWGGSTLWLFKGVRDYDEALRRIRNKRTKRDRIKAGVDGAGFMGFQHKMVSMLTYFMDWEKLLKPRFPYPSPADFHNFRLGLATGALVVHGHQGSVRSTEKLSAPWRDAVMAYLIERRADPVEVADALWLYSLVMCGNSALTASRKLPKNGSGMFPLEALPHQTDNADYYLRPRFHRQHAATCLSCLVRERCTLAIPSDPYYHEGQLVLKRRFRIEAHLPSVDPDTLAGPPGESAPVVLYLFEPVSP